jgi:cell fate (sporulation/competence/biofilm development) regulator YlbF (YheA/YmcA/DUF963 family)
MNVYDKAHELARALKETPEVAEYSEASKRIQSNENNKRLVDDFRQKQMEVYSMQMQGIQLSQEQMNSFNNLWNVISLNPEVRSFLEAEMKFSKLWGDIMKILGEAVGMDNNMGMNTN